MFKVERYKHSSATTVVEPAAHLSALQSSSQLDAKQALTSDPSNQMTAATPPTSTKVNKTSFHIDLSVNAAPEVEPSLSVFAEDGPVLRDESCWLGGERGGEVVAEREEVDERKVPFNEVEGGSVVGGAREEAEEEEEEAPLVRGRVMDCDEGGFREVEEDEREVLKIGRGVKVEEVSSMMVGKVSRLSAVVGRSGVC